MQLACVILGVGLGIVGAIEVYERVRSRALRRWAPGSTSPPAPTPPVHGPSAPIRLIGYWAPGSSRALAVLGFPNPAHLVGGGEADAEALADWLDAGYVASRYLGFSGCRLCGARNGSQERSDGWWIWPEGLSHYVREHGVRLPEEVVRHARTRERREVTGPSHIDIDWWLEWSAEHTPPPPPTPGAIALEEAQRLVDELATPLFEPRLTLAHGRWRLELPGHLPGVDFSGPLDRWSLMGWVMPHRRIRREDALTPDEANRIASGYDRTGVVLRIVEGRAALVSAGDDRWTVQLRRSDRNMQYVRPITDALGWQHEIEAQLREYLRG